MTEYSAEIMQMAERIATEVADASVYRRGTDNYARVWQGCRSGALAGIVQTTEMAAKLIEETQPQFTSGLSMLAPRLEDNRDGLPYATALRTFSHLPTVAAEKADG